MASSARAPQHRGAALWVQLCQTIYKALIWPVQSLEGSQPSNLRLSDIITTLTTTPRKDIPQQLAYWLDRLNPLERYVLIKLVTGGLRVRASARLTKVALTQLGNCEVNAIEEIWHGLDPPFAELFAWLEGRGHKPVNTQPRPLLPAHVGASHHRARL